MIKKTAPTKKIFCIISSIIIVLLGAFYLYVLPGIIDINDFKAEIQKKVKERTTYNLQSDKLKGETTLDLCYRIKTSYLALSDEKNHKIAEAKDVKVKIFIPSLIFREIRIADIDAKSLDADIERNKDGIFNIEKLFVKQKEKKMFTPVLKNSSINIGNHSIIFDDYLYEKPQHIKLNGILLSIENFTPKKSLKVTYNGNVEKNGTITYTNGFFHLKSPIKKGNASLVNNIEINGEVKNLLLQNYHYYLKSLIPDLTSISGLVNADMELKSNNFESGSYQISAITKNIYIKNRSKGEIFNSNDKANWVLKGEYNPKDLNFSYIKLNGSNYNINVKGTVENYKTLRKNLNLQINIPSSRIESIFAIFPKTLKVKHDFAKKLVKYSAKGNIKADVNVKGYYKVPTINGKISIDGVSFFNEGKEVPHSYGSVTFKGRGFNLAAKVFVRKNEIITVKGSIVPSTNNFLNLFIDTTNVDLNATEKKLLALQDVIGFPLGPVPQMILKGRGQMHLNVHDNPRETSLSGYLKPYNADVKYSELSKTATNVNGELIFDKQKIIYKNLSGYMDGSKVYANGYSSLDGDVDVDINAPNLNLNKAKDLVNNSILLVQTAQTLSFIKEINGYADLKFKLYGKIKTLTNDVPPDSLKASGEVVVKKAKVLLDGFSQYADVNSGKIDFNYLTVNLKNLKGFVANSPAELNGTVKNEILDLKIKSPQMNLASSLEFLNTSPNLKLVAKMFKDVKWVNGYVSAEMDLHGKLLPKNSKQQPDLFKRGRFNIIKAQFRHEFAPEPVNVVSGNIDADMKKTYFKNVRGFVYDAPFETEGRFENAKDKPIPFYSLKFRNFRAAKIKQIIPQNRLLSDLYDVRGLLNIDIKQNADDTFVKVNFNNLFATYMPLCAPLKIYSGVMNIDNHDLSLDSINAQLSQTPIFLNGEIKDYNGKFNIGVDAYSKIASEDIDRYINPRLSNPINVKGKIPLTFRLSGNLKNWDIKSKLDLDEKADISYRKSDFGLDSAKSVNLDMHGNMKSLYIRSFNIHQKANFGFTPVINISGIVDNYLTEPFYRNLSIVTQQPTSMQLLNAFFKRPIFKEGTFESNVNINGAMKLPSVVGSVSLKNVYIPRYQTRINSSDIDFTPESVSLKGTNIDIGSANHITLSATIDNIFDLPVSIKNAQINAQSIDMNKIAELVTRINNRKTSVLSSGGEFDLPPVVIQNASINTDELIVKNLITNDFKTTCTLTPDWILSLNDVSFKTAGGSVSGDAMYNLKTTDLETSLNLKNMQANAAASTILNFSNEIYGNLNGSVKFKTHGTTADDLVKNANGNAQFTVTNGRLVRLGSMEYLLKAGNVIKSGITGLNINNVVDLVVPQKTGYFKELKGSLFIEDGILKTNNISSKGDNLSLYLVGQWNLSTNKADITILGRLSKNVSSLLGPLGKLSINSVIGILPVNNDIELVKEISKIPGLEINNSNYRLFRVNFSGDYYDANSVKTFKWIEKS